jgi:Cupin superfamily protein
MAVSQPEVRELLDIDGRAFAANFSTRPFAVRHTVGDHPLLTLDALAELADRLPRASIERHRSDLGLMQPGGAPELEGPPSQTVREIDTGNTWMVLWYIEQDPAYKALLDETLDAVERHVGATPGGMRQRRGYIFISAPNATTPVHFDPEQNLLLQIRGRKEMNVGRFEDPADQEAELRRYFDGGHRNLDRMPALDEQFLMRPGDGVYVYPFAPHWVRNGPTPSVSLSITFRTAEGQRFERIHHINSRLRKLRLSPPPPGASPWRDEIKARAFELARTVRGHRGDAVHGEAKDEI